MDKLLKRTLNEKIRTQRYPSRSYYSLLAEDTGFEPADAVNVNGFQDRRFKPLSQSSTPNYYT